MWASDLISETLYVIFNNSELRKPRYTWTSLRLLTIVEFRINSLIVFVTYSVISPSCEMIYNFGLDWKMAGHHCYPVSQQYQWGPIAHTGETKFPLRRLPQKLVGCKNWLLSSQKQEPVPPLGICPPTPWGKKGQRGTACLSPQQLSMGEVEGGGRSLFLRDLWNKEDLNCDFCHASWAQERHIGVSGSDELYE